MGHKVAGGVVDEQGLVIGNTYDKYGSRNFVVKQLMAGFHDALDDLVGAANPSAIYEVGCGEGYWIAQWWSRGLAASGCDISPEVVALARENTAAMGLSPDTFEVRSIYDVRGSRAAGELVVCCEVLEHIDDPERGLRALRDIASGYIILSVPREPLWRVLNMVRGKYVTKLGNTPGHIQHWSSGSFRKLVEQYFDVIEVRAPLPWTMVLARARA
ncbi:MAG TPA: class I SAM-dependent methyltransferase [Luteibacter sp.]|uniref:class I SAM-dependent methyltransferase n=1 Tax=Luteibacter sp. TaxID=1886636 RepID=UPI002F42F342